MLGEAGGKSAGKTRPGACSLAIHMYLLRRIIPEQFMLADSPLPPELPGLDCWQVSWSEAPPGRLR